MFYKFVIYFHNLAEKKTSMGKDWHGPCLKCERCNKTLTPGNHAVREDKPYCHTPCYSALFGPKGTFLFKLGHLKYYAMQFYVCAFKK